MDQALPQYILPICGYNTLRNWFVGWSRQNGADRPGNVLLPQNKGYNNYPISNAVADKNGWRFNFHVKIYYPKARERLLNILQAQLEK